MLCNKFSFLVAVVVLFCACNKEFPYPESQDINQLIYSPPPFNLKADKALFASNILYGTNTEYHTFDIIMPESNTPTPLVIYFHGGGFTTGDKSTGFQKRRSGICSNKIDAQDEILLYLENGIAYASANYSLLEDNDSDGIMKPLHDAKNLIQFIRHYAAKLNIDTGLIGLRGKSAGAGMALWLSFSDNMGDSSSINPIYWHNTRVAAVGVENTQSTYDFVKWNEVFSDFNFNLETTLESNKELQSLVETFYVINSTDEIYSTEISVLRDSVDLLGLMSSHDPEIWIYNEMEKSEDIYESRDILLHHPYHATAIKKQALYLGLDHWVFDGIEPWGENVAEFMVRKLDK